MPFPRTPKSEKKKKISDGSGKKEVTPLREQLEEQRKKQKVREMEEKLKALGQQRGAVKGKLTRVRNAIAQRTGVPNPNLRKVNFLKLHLETVKSCYGEYNLFQNEILALPLSEEQKKEHEAKYEEFELLYNELVIQLNDLLDELGKPAANPAPVPDPRANVVIPNYLPPLNVPLPTFDGAYENWFSFKHLFQNVMARYTAESPAIKLYHLRNSLVGKAAGVIDQDIVNNNDYDAAWAILQERYEDKRVIVDQHIEALYNLPRIARDDAVTFRKFVDTCVKQVEALKSLQLPVDGLAEQMIVNLLAARMDRGTRMAWEAEQTAGALPTYAATIEFLKKSCRILEKLESTMASADSTKPQRSVALLIAGVEKCTVCDRQHDLKWCDQFKERSVNAKYSHLRRHGLCFNCMMKGHRVAECTSGVTCKICKKRHHTMLHSDGAKKQEPTPRPTTAVTLNPAATNRSQPTRKRTLLSTAVVEVHGGSSGPRLCRTLIDSCSQSHFITERFANKLGIAKERADYQVSGLQDSRTRINHLVRATVKSRVSDFSAEMELLVTPTIIDVLPPEPIDITSWNIPPNIELADPSFNLPGEVDMLLGAGMFWDLIKSGKITLAENLPSLRATELGWVVGGVLSSPAVATTSSFCGAIKLAEKFERSSGRQILAGSWSHRK